VKDVDFFFINGQERNFSVPSRIDKSFPLPFRFRNSLVLW
jgi:hypothetical protein